LTVLLKAAPLLLESHEPVSGILGFQCALFTYFSFVFVGVVSILILSSCIALFIHSLFFNVIFNA